MAFVANRSVEKKSGGMTTRNSDFPTFFQLLGLLPGQVVGFLVDWLAGWLVDKLFLGWQFVCKVTYWLVGWLAHSLGWHVVKK